MQFNKQQQKAIEFYGGACAVIAGAGSGKSTVLLNRIKNLIEVHNVNEEDILAISFTSNIAKELTSKLNKMGYRNVNTGTFHSICGRILSENNIDVSRLIKSWQSENCFKTIDRKVDVKDIQSFIDYQKNYLKSYKNEFMSKDSNYSEIELRKFFKSYEEFKNKNNLYDFQDWLILCYELLRIKKDYKGYKFVLVDEHQDSNLVQNLLLKQWCKSGNIFCVFDYRQAIYTFRGGNPEYCMNFNKEWDDATVINLDINYRSNKNIVNKANNFIKKYYGKYEYYSDSVSDNQDDGNIKINTYCDKQSESKKVIDKIEKLINNGENPNDISILYRMNSNSDYIENELKDRSIPYYISKESSFFKRTEIVAIISYLRLIDNLSDDGAFENIFKLHNYPIKFFKNDILNDIEDFSATHNIPLYESFITMKYDKSWQKDNVNKFKEIINNLKLQKDKNVKIDTLIDNIKRLFKIEEFILDKYSNEEDQNERIESIEVLKTFIKGDNLDKFILYIDTNNNKKKKDIDGVKLLTIHAAKGLEFKYVFVISIEDDKFPHKKSDLIDEARLFYVAITRPKENLYLSQIGDNNKFIKEYIS